MSTQEEQRGHVVVGVDGSERGYVGVRYAAAEADRRGVPLDIVHITPGYLPVGPFLMIPDGSLQDFGSTVAQRAECEARNAAPDVQVKAHLVPGNRVRELVDFSREAALLILGARHLSAMDHIWTGATVTGVVSRASCPVAVIPATWEPPPAPHRRVVAGYKASEHSAELFEDAFVVAEEMDAELVVLHAWRLEGVYDDVVAGRVEEQRWNGEQAARIEAVLADYRESFPDVRVRVRVLHDGPTHALVHASRSADRVILVKPAHLGYLHHLGPTARAVLRMSECPVEIVPPRRQPEVIAGLSVEQDGALVR
jgi:nucleotide-binding universal stress UspA family protein